MRFFNEFIEIRRTGGKLPHWQQPGATYFITWRLDDSIPRELMERWTQERTEWMLKNPKPWTEGQEDDYHRIFSMEIMRLMDLGYGSCILRDEKMRRIVTDSLGHADGSRYDLHAWVTMPNHVHVLFSTSVGETLEGLVGGWKKFTARRINLLAGTEGRLWQKNYFDTMIRDWDHMLRVARYVRGNPRKAGLREGEFTLYEAAWVQSMLG